MYTMWIGRQYMACSVEKLASKRLLLILCSCFSLVFNNNNGISGWSYWISRILFFLYGTLADMHDGRKNTNNKLNNFISNARWKDGVEEHGEQHTVRHCVLNSDVELWMYSLLHVHCIHKYIYVLLGRSCYKRNAMHRLLTSHLNGTQSTGCYSTMDVHRKLQRERKLEWDSNALSIVCHVYICA